MTGSVRFILADPVNWECVQEALDSDGLLKVRKFYEVREKGSTSTVIGFDRADSGLHARSTHRNTIQWELFPYDFVDLKKTLERCIQELEKDYKCLD